MAALETCQFTEEKVEAILSNIQKSVDQLAYGNYLNMNQWIANLDNQIESRLARRLEDALKLWNLVYSASEEVDEYKERNVVLPPVHKVIIDVCLAAQTIYISPTIDQSRGKLIDQLVEWHSIVTNKPRIKGARFQLAMDHDELIETYSSVLSKMPSGTTTLEACYATIDKIMSQVEQYVAEWLRYQALWNLQAEMVYENLGVDIGRWMKILVEIRKSRSTFDTQETRKEIFPVIIDYAKVQSKVTLKYDYWHQEILQKFGNTLGNKMTSFYKDISQSRTELESQGVDSDTTSDAVALITYIQKLKKQAKSGQEAVDQFKAAHRLLSQQRYQFPNQWLYAENVEGEWSSLTDILMRKDAAIHGQVNNLQTKICQEDELIEKRTLETLSEWERAKPVEGTQRPQEALIVLLQFEQKMTKLTEDRVK